MRFRKLFDFSVHPTVLLAFEAKHLNNKDTFSKSDPFLEMRRANENGEFSLVHPTEAVDNDLAAF